MIALKIMATPTPGAALDDVAADSQHIADVLGAAVEFQFNGMRCLATPGGKAETLVKNIDAGFQRLATGVAREQIALS